MLDAHHPGQDQRPGGQQPGDRRWNRTGGEQHHHHGDDDQRPFGAGAEWDRLTPDDPWFVDDEHVGILEVDGEGVPRALQQHHVTGGEADLLGAEILPLAVDGEHDEVAALGDHPGERRLPDQPRPGADDDLGHARLPT